MKTFKDTSNVSWTVFEVRREITTRGDASYLPSGYSEGWLCFECVGAKRRLLRYPERWREFDDSGLQKLLEQAIPAPRTSLRGAEDLGDGPSAEV